MAKNGWESVASSAAFGRSSVIATTWAPTRSATPGKARTRAMLARFASTASASKGAPSWNRTPSRRVNVQRRASRVAQAVASAGSGWAPSAE
jgi:hypothetical protein